MSAAAPSRSLPSDTRFARILLVHALPAGPDGLSDVHRELAHNPRSGGEFAPPGQVR
ncbi:MAG TPA: hypothetical protein VHC49_07785 [Mycobacteriales bacterium]|nr:hypothetical protein [Mycobacteriales bacterium]